SMAIGSHDGYVYLINLKDGSRPWSYKIEGAVKSMAYIRNGSILCIGGTDKRFRALDMDTGKELGSIKAGHWVTSISASENGLAVFGAGNTLSTVKIIIEGGEGPAHPKDSGGSTRLMESLVYVASMALPALGAAAYLLARRRRDGGRVV
ncbi:MAG: WD40 repeat domain-containing protein, partial [Candidatus Bathyarchaeia archaeon]